MTKMRILFVCLGNICRSPAAQAVMESVVVSRGLEDRFEIDSAGTASYHIGKLPDPRMISAGSRRGLVLDSRAKAVTKELIWERHLVLAMDRDNEEDIRRISGKAVPHLQLLSDYLDESWPRNVPDPYYGKADGFEFVLNMLEAACPLILEKHRNFCM